MQKYLKYIEEKSFKENALCILVNTLHKVFKYYSDFLNTIKF